MQKTQLIHTPYAPTISGNSAVAVNGDQVLKVTSLSPSGTVLNYVDEGAGTSLPDSQKQFRLQVTASGSAETLLLTVLQARGSSDPDLALDLQQNAGQMVLTLTHPTLGSAQFVFSTGMTSTGGKFAYATPGNSLVLSPLLTRVQGSQITDAGPVWEVVTTAP